MSHFNFSAEIRKEYQYNNYVYNIMPLLFTAYANTSFIDFVQERIFDPLSIGATYNFLDAVESNKMTHSFLRKNRNLTACQEVHARGDFIFDAKCMGQAGSAGYWSKSDNYGFAGAGGIVMAPTDMVRFSLHAVLKTGKMGERTPRTDIHPQGGHTRSHRCSISNGGTSCLP